MNFNVEKYLKNEEYHPENFMNNSTNSNRDFALIEKLHYELKPLMDSYSQYGMTPDLKMMVNKNKDKLILLGKLKKDYLEKHSNSNPYFEYKKRKTRKNRKNRKSKKTRSR